MAGVFAGRRWMVEQGILQKEASLENDVAEMKAVLASSITMLSFVMLIAQTGQVCERRRTRSSEAYIYNEQS